MYTTTTIHTHFTVPILRTEYCNGRDTTEVYIIQYMERNVSWIELIIIIVIIRSDSGGIKIFKKRVPVANLAGRWINNDMLYYILFTRLNNRERRSRPIYGD